VIEAGVGDKGLYEAFKPDDDESSLLQINDRPIYYGKGFSEIDTRLLVFAGGRWIGSYVTNFNKENIVALFGEEYHAFWDRTYDFQTFLLGDRSSAYQRSDPIGVGFHAITFKGGDYGRIGKLDPAPSQSSQGYFHCKKERCKKMRMGVRGSSCGINGTLICDDDEYPFSHKSADYHDPMNPQCICSASDGTKNYTWDTKNWGYFCENGRYFYLSTFVGYRVPYHYLGVSDAEVTDILGVPEEDISRLYRTGSDFEADLLQVLDQNVSLQK